ncbi:MAG: hypothetical protein AB7E81_05980 [Hyphomicrobiaceae bacterium]
MSGDSYELDVARIALMRARDDLLRQLDAESAWRAFMLLEAGGASSDDTRAKLVARLDASVPQWRTLVDIDAAIAALGPAASDVSRDMAVPPPLPTPEAELSSSEVPHVRVEPERMRYGSTQRRPAAAKDERPAPVRPPSIRGALRLAETQSSSTAPQRRTPSAGGRLIAALGLAGEGPARLSAIEADVERLMRRDAGVRDGAPPPPIVARPPARVDRPVLEPAEPPVFGEEAEVEIVALAPVPPRDPRRPIARLADRLSHVDGEAEAGARVEPIVSMQAGVEEASVEIEAVEQAPPRPNDKDAPKA